VVARVDLDTLEARIIRKRLEEAGQRTGLDVGKPDMLDVGVLKQVICAGGALEPSAHHEHVHRASIGFVTRRPAGVEKWPGVGRRLESGGRLARLSNAWCEAELRT
jgi:hypothetical protein